MTTLNALPSLPSVSRVRASNKCGCGCGRLTGRTFAPGHDARLKGLILRVLAAVMTLDDVAAWGGEDTRKAVEGAIANPVLLKRWNIEVPAVEVPEEVEEQVG